MDRPTDLKRVLADEIRAAVAETAPAPGDAREAGDAFTAAGRASLSKAAELLTPSVPAGAPLEPAKRLVIRALRFLWRNQSNFNSLSMDATSGLADSLDRLRRDVDELARRVGIDEARLAVLESDGRPAATGSSALAPVAAAGIPPGVYALFEERFRGAPAEIARGQRFYLEVLRNLPGPVLDVGCGRGEFLELLKAEGIASSGVESNPVSVEAARARGLSVEGADALQLLGGRPPGKLGAVVAFQVVEHWAPEGIFRFLQLARRALAPGGVLIAETINVDSLSAWKAFYLDPTHVRPVPPDALRFLAEAAGFTDARIEYRSPLPEASRLAGADDDARKLNALLFAPQDYALIARVPAAP
ncbi:MAG TPA: class I SAM-dependent methyltransferase [Thermoanaerobaculia bacterium]|nr:class I SAM-dependent methyltransferase [Thermoanaerobaculia bacterium]